MASLPTCLLLPFIAVFLSFATVRVSTQDSIDQIISDAANSSSQFRFYDSSHGVVKTELDMLFTTEQWQLIQRLNSTGESQRKKRKATRPIARRWTGRKVPYEIRGYFNSAERAQVKLAIDEWNYYTCLNFRAAGYGDHNKIIMQNGGGCSSYVGMIGGAQYVSLASGCRIKRIIVHELGHAVGFQHEQTRPDRDNYVYILHRNIPGGVRYNFQKYSTSVVNDYGVPYDYKSVMHYGAYAFSTNGRMTIQTRDKNYQNRIGKSPGLSFRDIKLANLMYNCGGHCSDKSACPSGGYRAKDCKCYCPSTSQSRPIKLCSGGGGGGKKECVDDNSSCGKWASTDECKKNPKYMLVSCKKSCKVCNGGGGGGGGGNKKCVDDNSSCGKWASTGECKKNPKYMLVSCKKSCKVCNGGGGGGGGNKNCVDKNKHCSFWANSRECNRNPKYMHPNCPKSCNKCGTSTDVGGGVAPCIDENINCVSWAQRGECISNPNYMTLYCKRSCNSCSS